MEQDEIRVFKLPNNFNALKKEEQLKLLEEKMIEFSRSINEGVYGSLFYHYQIIKNGKVVTFL